MRLNHDCIRDTLIALEELLVVGESGYTESLDETALFTHGKLRKYPKEEILYSIQKLDEADFISVHPMLLMNGYHALFSGTDGITYTGHRYLEAIRSDTVWAKVRKSLVKVGGSAPFGVLLSVAEEFLKKQLLP